jgi:hypothetical protein
MKFSLLLKKIFKIDCPLKKRTYGENIHRFFIAKINIIIS